MSTDTSSLRAPTVLDPGSTLSGVSRTASTRPGSPESAPANEVASGERFAFGANWRRFLDVLDEDRINAARESLVKRLETDSLSGRRFLDAGCGSGLFSLAAAQLGAAEVHSFDVDPESVQCARVLAERYGPGTTTWRIEPGSVLDERYLASLGAFDVVYSWGVLHHTGDLARGLVNIASVVAPGGVLFISVYNDQGLRSRVWREIKRTYNRIPPPLRMPYALVVMAPFELRALLISAVRGEPKAYLELWSNQRARGMSRWHDLIDWVGGYPFEVAKPDQVFNFYHSRGFELLQLVVATSGCNEYVLRRT